MKCLSCIYEQFGSETETHLVKRWRCSVAHPELRGVALLAKGLYPVDLPAVRNPDFVDIVFHNRAVLWTTRLVLVFGGVFIVVSIGIRLKNGELLKRAGPF